jgi:hypothetical protein
VLKLSSFVLTDTVFNLLNDAEYRRNAISVLKKIGVRMVYLESYCGSFLTEEQLRSINSLFASEGFETAGGVATGLWSEGFGEKSENLYLTRWEGINTPERIRIEKSSIRFHKCINVCLTSKSSRAGLKRIMERTAGVFDTILTDDIMAQWCFCPRCFSLFQSKYNFLADREQLALAIEHNDAKIIGDWERFSADVVKEVFRNYVIKPSKEVNPNVKLILKVAEWYEMYPIRGIVLPELIPMFDGLQIGSECRENAARYGSSVTPQIARKLAGEKFCGAWVDLLNDFSWWELPTSERIYLEQLKECVLGQTPEICLFSLREQIDPKCQSLNTAFISQLPTIIKVHNSISNSSPLGLSVIKPVASPHVTFHHETYILDILGSIGIPINIEPDWQEIGTNVLVTAHSAHQLRAAQLLDKENVIFTSGAITLFAKEKNMEVLRIAGLDETSAIMKEAVMASALSFGEGTFPRPVNLHTRSGAIPLGPALQVKNAQILMSAHNEDGDYPIVTKRTSEGLNVYCVGLTWAPWYLKYGYPESLRELLRDIVGTMTGIKLNSRGEGMRNISLHVFSSGAIFINSLDDSAMLLDVCLMEGKMISTSNMSFVDIVSGKGYKAFAENGWIRIPVEMYSGQILGFQMALK